jgi:hypothetical protein
MRSRKVALAVTSLAVGLLAVLSFWHPSRRGDQTAAMEAAPTPEALPFAGRALQLATSAAPPAEASAASPTARPASSEVREDPTALRDHVQRIVESEVAALDSVAGLRSYLAELEKRAAAKGRVSLVEIEPGLEAIRKFQQELGEHGAAEASAEFSTRMQKLSQALTPAAFAAPRAAAAERGSLLEAARTGRDEITRELAIKTYLDAIDGLPPEEKAGAIASLEQARAER